MGYGSMFPLSHQTSITPLMATLLKPGKKQQEHGVTSEGLTECAAVLLHHERIRLDVQEPVSVLRHVLICSLVIYTSRGETLNCVCPRHPMIPVAVCDGQRAFIS